MTPLVRAEGLRKVYQDEGRGPFEAVRGISLECSPGEIFGLLGSNGAGKTTTLKMLATLLPPTAGRASICGFDINSQSHQVRQKLGFYSSSTGLYPRLSVTETLDFFARINGYPKARVAARVQELIEHFQLEQYRHVRVERLSSGNKQKVSIARTIAHDPPVLIFDEPTVGLDVVAALAFQQRLKELRTQGKTIILSTHIMSEAEKLCDRIAIVDSGQILACAQLEELRTASGLHYLEDIFIHYLQSNKAPG
ncbi:ABC transporter ATP-binding protein [bacterium]|nr:ABC transporter ATP-binding protein [bacterium]